MNTGSLFERTYVALPAIGYDSNSRIGEIVKQLDGLKAQLFERELVAEFQLGFEGAKIATQEAQVILTRTTGKGFFVKNGLRNALQTGCQYFVCCDASGKIQFENILKIAENLKGGKYNCVLGKRVGATGISKEREIAENFENFLIEKKFKLKEPLKDAQCGCWGFSLKELPEITLGGEGYELELEILVEALRQPKSRIAYCSVNVLETGKTLFQNEVHQTKLKFLRRKLPMTKDELRKVAAEFNIAREKLPEEYMKIIAALPEDATEGKMEKEIGEINNRS